MYCNSVLNSNELYGMAVIKNTLASNKMSQQEVCDVCWTQFQNPHFSGVYMGCWNRSHV